MEDDSLEVSAVLHELKNPLLAIERLAELLIEQEPLSGNARRKLELIQQSAEKASRQLRELKLSSPPVLNRAFSFEPVDLSALAGQIVERFQPHAEYKGQTLRCTDLNEDAVVIGDEVRLREAMKNLVNNALKYSPRGGTVEVSVVETGETVRFSVSDDGPGLSEDDLHHLFKPFQRLSAQPTDDEPSLGLGLYLVKQIVDRHDGEVDVTTTKGEGSTFALLFPTPAQSSGNGEATR